MTVATVDVHGALIVFLTVVTFATVGLVAQLAFDGLDGYRLWAARRRHPSAGRHRTRHPAPPDGWDITAARARWEREAAGG